MFKVGEIGILVNATHFSEYEGEPAVIIGGLATRRSIDVVTMKAELIPAYKVKVIANGFVMNAMQWQLRKPGEGQPESEKKNELAPKSRRKISQTGVLTA